MAEESPMTVDEVFANFKTRIAAMTPYLIGLDLLEPQYRP